MNLFVFSSHPSTLQFVRHLVESDEYLNHAISKVEGVREFVKAELCAHCGHDPSLGIFDFCQRKYPAIAVLPLPSEGLCRWTGLVDSGEHLFTWSLLRLGYAGVVELANECRTELNGAIRATLSDHTEAWTSPLLLKWLAQTSVRAYSPIGGQLTQREKEVLPLLLATLTNKEIAGTLGVSERTVKFHVTNILAKHYAPSRVHLLKILK